MSTQDNTFAPRPWPPRRPEDSPFLGRRVLVIHGDPRCAAEIASQLAQAGCLAQGLSDPSQSTEALRRGEHEVVLVDTAVLSPDQRDALLQFAQAHGTALIALEPSTPGALHLPPQAVLAVLPRAVSVDVLRLTVGRALERSSLTEENRRLREHLAERYAFGSFLTRDPIMTEALRTLASVADTHANVLLLGESGTGKTMLSRTIHQHSSRADGPFVVVNCGSLPATLLESELFGHVRGAFSGALRDRPGRFEQAHQGTIFLDEINSASLDLQVKLLHVLQEGSFTPVGGSQEHKVDVRLIAASNVDLDEEIAAGRFREDLFYRIHVVAVELPPLRERSGDLHALVQHFLARFASEHGKSVSSIHPDCLTILAANPWPGNVRQLENAIERAVLLAHGNQLLPSDLGRELIESADLGPGAGEAGASLLDGLRNLSRISSLKEALEGPERIILVRALELCGGNRKATAEMLDINRTTLFNKMKKYGLMDLTFEVG